MKTNLQFFYYLVASLGWALTIIFGHLSYTQAKQIKKFKADLEMVKKREKDLEQMIQNSKTACEFLAGIISDEKIQLDTAARVREIFKKTI
jgi:hypothetical protein